MQSIRYNPSRFDTACSVRNYTDWVVSFIYYKLIARYSEPLSLAPAYVLVSYILTRTFVYPWVFIVFFSFLFSSKIMHVFLAVNIVKKIY